MAGNEITRRKFVRDTTVAAAGIAVGMSAAEAAQGSPATQPAAEKTRSYNEKMEYRTLGKTGLWISAVSLGGHWKKIPYKFGTEDFARNRREVVSACIDCGINYIDACTGQEVQAYSAALRGRRDKMYFGYSYYEHEMRFPEWQTMEKLLESLDDMMGQAKLEYVDLWRPTCYWTPSTNHTVAHEEAIVGALEKAIKAGKVRFGGLSTHKHDWAIRMIETYPTHIQVVVVPYTAGSKKAHARVEPGKDGWKGITEKRNPKEIGIYSLIDAVKKNRVGWVGIKPFASGSVFKSRGMPDSATKKEDDERARMTLRYVLQNDALTAAIPGLITADQVRNAAKAVQERRKLELAETQRLQQTVDEMWANLPENYQWLKTEWEYV
ncbi:MAG: aldo/keto reductase [Planctomycetota bacterium]|nr:MAG: aldo/keto reductase [Planctomycetota bacterium]